jgi:hypothetical protein
MSFSRKLSGVLACSFFEELVGFRKVITPIGEIANSVFEANSTTTQNMLTC